MKFRIRRRHCCRFSIKGTCVLITILAISLLFFLENRRWAAIAKMEAETKFQTLVSSRDTPSSVFVLPDSDTVIYNPLNHCDMDNGSNVLTLFMVVSVPENEAARNVIRSGFKFYLEEYNDETGGYFETFSKLNTLLFFIGLPKTDAEKENLFTEAEMHSDVIIDDLQESYMNLTLKSLRMLKWVEQNCYNAEFTVKVDDDFHINLRRLLGFLEAMSLEGSEENMIGGQLLQGAEPVRDPASVYGKWYTPLELWPDPTFPDYVAGYFYVMGKEARSKVYKKALLKPLFHLEDVFVTGIVAKELPEIKLTNLQIIAKHWLPVHNWITSSCDIVNHYFGVHFHFKQFNYLHCWKSFNDKAFVCSNWPLLAYCLFDYNEFSNDYFIKF